MAKKVVSQRKHGDAGLEAPRNSLELLGQTCPPGGGGGVGDYLPYSYELFKHEWSKIHREEEDSMKKKSINREITTTTNNNRVPNTRRTTPSVVARLMGMDMDTFPSSVNHQVQNNFHKKNENNIKTQEDIHHIINHPNHHHRPEHPQEEELQKFKKEFESWQQTARFKRTIPKQKLLAQETLTREETLLYSDSRRRTRISNEKPSIALEDQRLGNSSSGPNKIVILRPGSIDRLVDSEEESWVGGSSSTNSIEEFLEEVKERLKSEFQGKYCHNLRGTSEKPLDAMKKQIEKQVRESEIQIINETNSFRYAPDDSVHIMHHHREPSLIRSLSAPLSGTSFGKLLLEDPHVLTGAHIQRKHEAVEKKKTKKKKEEKSELKETVSNFKQSFTLGGQLFRRRFQSADDVYSCRNDIMSGPTVVMNYGNIQENATEVPPSPASSLSELSPPRESSLPQVFREINSNLSELRRQLNGLESNSPKDAGSGSEEDELPEADMMEENQAETYIRELLIVSGLYNYYYNNNNNNSTTTLSRGGGKPINNNVFKKVEKSYMKTSKNGKESKMNRQLLFDLTNEAIVEQSMTVPTASGSKLLNNVWERVRTYLYPIPADKFRYSIDGMVKRDLRSAPWTMLVKDEEVDYVGKMVESQIIARLIEEVVKDLQQLHLERRWRKYNR